MEDCIYLVRQLLSRDHHHHPRVGILLIVLQIRNQIGERLSASCFRRHHYGVLVSQLNGNGLEFGCHSKQYLFLDRRRGCNVERL